MTLTKKRGGTTSLEKPPSKRINRGKNVQSYKIASTGSGRMPSSVTLHGIEFHEGIFGAWFEYGRGKRQGEGFYLRPFENAYHQTVEIVDEPIGLYGVNSESMIELFPIDFLFPRREFGTDRIQRVSPDKEFPWKMLLWIRPSEAIDGRAQWTLHVWLSHVKQQFERFVRFTMEHSEIFEKYNRPVTLTIAEHDGLHCLGDYILDSDVMNILRCSYEMNKEEFLEHSEGPNSIRVLFFGNNVDQDEYRFRIESAWFD